MVGDFTFFYSEVFKLQSYNLLVNFATFIGLLVMGCDKYQTYAHHNADVVSVIFCIYTEIYKS